VFIELLLGETVRQPVSKMKFRIIAMHGLLITCSVSPAQRKEMIALEPRTESPEKQVTATDLVANLKAITSLSSEYVSVARTLDTSLLGVGSLLSHKMSYSFWTD
jgi:hypothetical protein